MARRFTSLPYLAGGFVAGTVAALSALAPTALPASDAPVKGTLPAEPAGAAPLSLDSSARSSGDPVHPWSIEQTLLELSRGERRPASDVPAGDAELPAGSSGEVSDVLLALPDIEMPGAERALLLDGDRSEQRVRGHGDLVDGLPEGRWVVLAEDGEPAAEGSFDAGLPEGAWTFWHGNGELRLEGSFEDGLASGPWRTWDEQGNAVFETAYLGGEQHGPRTQWFPTGEPELFGAHDHGLRSGEWTSFHTNGGVRFQGAYARGLRDGLWNEWYADGAPSMQGTYDDGRRDGPWVRWYPGGQIEERGTFVAGRREGAWEFYHADGEPDPRSGIYRAGRRVER